MSAKATRFLQEADIAGYSDERKMKSAVDILQRAINSIEDLRDSSIYGSSFDKKSKKLANDLRKLKSAFQK